MPLKVGSVAVRPWPVGWYMLVPLGGSMKCMTEFQVADLCFVPAAKKHKLVRTNPVRSLSWWLIP